MSRKLPKCHPGLDARSRQYELYSWMLLLTNGIKTSKESCLNFLRFKFSYNSSTSRKFLLRNLQHQKEYSECSSSTGWHLPGEPASHNACLLASCKERTAVSPYPKNQRVYFSSNNWKYQYINKSFLHVLAHNIDELFSDYFED